MASSLASLDRVGEAGDSYRNGGSAGYRYRTEGTTTTTNPTSNGGGIGRFGANNSTATGGLASEAELKKAANSLELGGVASEEIDYKKLCKQLLKENEVLRKRIKELEEAEKKRDQDFGREKRGLQRTISEQEEELKQLNEIKADNVKLKDENAALIRVISKLSK